MKPANQSSSLLWGETRVTWVSRELWVTLAPKNNDSSSEAGYSVHIPNISDPNACLSLSFKAYKSFCSKIRKPLMKIINTLLSEIIFSRALKEASIYPLLKMSSFDQKANYTLVSNLYFGGNYRQCWQNDSRDSWMIYLSVTNFNLNLIYLGYFYATSAKSFLRRFTINIK